MTDQRTLGTLGMTGLVVAGLLAGFLVATTAAGQEFATVGTIGDDGLAYALPLSEERVRFSLEPQANASSPEASFALYDPDDAFFGYFELSGEDQTVDVLADAKGDWVVFVTEATRASLAVQLPSEEDGESVEDRMVPLEVTTFRKTVADQDGGELDRTLAVRIDERPAIATLEYEGTATALDAVASTDEGPVYEIHDDRANVTENGTTVHQGTHTATPQNLVAGTYQVTATAQAFDGILDLVYKVYERDTLSTNAADPDQPVNKTMEALLEEGTVLGTVKTGQAMAFRSQSARQVLLVAEEHTSARLFVYDPSDRMVGQAQLGEETGSTWDWEDEEDGNETAVFSTFTLNTTGEYVVYAADIYGGSDQVHLVLDDVYEAEEGRHLELERVHVQMGEGSSYFQSEGTKEVEVPGGLVDVQARSNSPAETDLRVSVTGPDGLVYEREASLGTFGAELTTKIARYPENFTTGTHVIEWSSDAPMGSMEADLFSFHR